MSRRTFVFYRRSRPHPGAIDTDKPVPYSVAVFRAPDNIQLELIHLPG
jgi:glyoxylase I family protein